MCTASMLQHRINSPTWLHFHCISVKNCSLKNRILLCFSTLIVYFYFKEHFSSLSHDQHYTLQRMLHTHITQTSQHKGHSDLPRVTKYHFGKYFLINIHEFSRKVSSEKHLKKLCFWTKKKSMLLDRILRNQIKIIVF